MKLPVKIAVGLVLTALSTGLAYGQHASSAQQTVTFGVTRVHQVAVTGIPSPGAPAFTGGLRSAPLLQVLTDSKTTKVTISKMPQPKLFQEDVNHAEGISVGAPIPAAGRAAANARDVEMELRSVVNSSGSVSFSGEPVLITITD